MELEKNEKDNKMQILLCYNYFGIVWSSISDTLRLSEI